MAARLDFEIDSELETGLITGHAGVPGLIEAFRQTGTATVIDREIQLKSRKRGLGAAEMVESLLALWAAGEDKVKLLKAAWDAVGSEFASRHTQYEMFYAGARFVATGHSYRTFDWAGARGMVDHLLSTYELEEAGRPSV